MGQHPLVSCLLKGVFNTRPPTPWYLCTQDLSHVLTSLEGLPDNDELSLKDLTHKLAMLMALSNSDRCSELAMLDLNYCMYQMNGVKFIIPV